MWAVILVAVVSIGMAPVPASPACYEFNCEEDNRACKTDEGCFGPCLCELETNTCRPR